MNRPGRLLRYPFAAASRLRRIEWKAYNRKKRRRLKSTDFSIISSNCNGTFIYRDMGLRYLSPTIGLAIPMTDFVKMCRNLPWYMQQELVEYKEEPSCPAGMLGDVRVNFVHYQSFDEAREKWERRKRRINWEKLFIIGSERDSCTYETLQEFDRLPYKNKVVFTRIEYPEIQSAYCLRGFEDREELGDTTAFKKQLRLRRYLDDFDAAAFLNGEGLH